MVVLNIRPLLLIVVFLLAVTDLHAQAVYRLTFNATWTSSDLVQPQNYPRSAHFTELVGATHASNYSIWRAGTLASSEVEYVAELGFNNPLFNALQMARNSVNLGPDIELEQLFDLPNSATTRVTFTDERPLISLISMVAPSPDWFVGVSGLNLKPNGEWLNKLTVELRPYDAGTEDGTGFSLSNPVTSPPQAITRVQGFPFNSQNPVLGTLSLELISAPTPQVPAETKTVDLTPIYPLLLEELNELE
ncbi:MAG: spondin domain-containing protein [Acidiferrobacterales bacterium]|nr:spondin domain-containing protein [Acidiferrobacterales bacterium]